MDEKQIKQILEYWDEHYAGMLECWPQLNTLRCPSEFNGVKMLKLKHYAGMNSFGVWMRCEMGKDAEKAILN